MRVFLTRHGQSEYNVQNRLGGNSSLSKNGEQYAVNLEKLFRYCEPNLQIWCSALKRTQQTAQVFRIKPTIFKELDEINAGICEKLTIPEVKAKYPIIDRKRNSNKYEYRYPGGESYIDLVKRLRPIFNTLSQLAQTQCTVLIICHQAVARMIYAFLTHSNYEVCTSYDIPLHTLMQFDFNQGFWKESKRIPIKSVL